MKIAGQQINGVNEDILVLPRKPQPIVFKGRAVKDFDVFDALRPVPKPPGVLTKQGFKPDPEDQGYLAQMADHALSRMGYMVILTLEPSQIEWDTVKADDPTTWINWADDFANAGLTGVEQQRILNFVLEVNALDEKKLEQARADFLRGLDQAQDS